MFEATSAARLIVSVGASPKVRLPDIVALPVTIRFPPTDILPVVVTASI